ncbi:universal stress protein [Kitasatospora nipponensis]|uniref:Universal stress protein n=1 Tax=Kitasatospora nipponensis TaxID=258049 RepID=A0ABP4GF23_9ACTN
MPIAGPNRPIVLGVDAVDPSPAATAWAADEANRCHVPLHLVHCVPPLVSGRRDLERSWHEGLRREGWAQIEKVRFLALERHPELAVTGEVVDGIPGQVLVGRSPRAGLVVLGSRQLSPVAERLSTYSVALPVSAQAACPVVVAHEPEHATGRPPYVVVGVDGSPGSAAAVDFAHSYADQRGASLRAIFVWQPSFFAVVDEHATEQEAHRLLSEATAGRTDRYPDTGLTHEVLRGHPVAELTGASRQALAVVVGRRGHGGFTGMRLGSVPRGLLHHARCPIITVPAGPAGDQGG